MHTAHNSLGTRVGGTGPRHQPFTTPAGPVCSLSTQCRSSRRPVCENRSTHRGSSVSCRAEPSAGEGKEPADIIAEDQGGQEFDTNSKDKGKYEAEDESSDSKGEGAEVKDAAADDQGGREFEPLPIKRILVDN